MKKIFTLCVAFVAAMSMSAEVRNLTCAEAASEAALLQDGETGKDSVAVTGYVTSTDGKISKGQQTFWMDDEKGSKKTFEGYWCNLPEGEDALNVGDKVVIKGLLMRYKSTYEMKNGDITILERAVVKIDTIQATVCEAIEEGEALAAGDYTPDVFVVEGVVSSVLGQNDEYQTQKFDVVCEDNDKTLQAYNVTMEKGYAAIGDKVRLTGKLTKYVKDDATTIELIGAGLVIEKGAVKIDTIYTSVADALTAAKALENNKVSAEVYVITGYIDSISSAYAEKYDNISFFMCDDLNAPAFEFQAYRVKGGETLKVGDKVTVTGNLMHYYKAATEDQAEKHGYQTNAGATFVMVTESAVENVISNTKNAVKIVRDGQLIIIRNGVEYNATGAAL